MAGFLVDDLRPWIPDGEYELAYVDYSTALLFKGAPKLVVRFRVTTMGEHFGTILEKWYRVRQLKGKAKKYGDFRVGGSSDFYRDYCRLVGAPRRKDRLSLTALNHKLLIGSTRTVTMDRNQNELADGARYSVVEHLRLA